MDPKLLATIIAVAKKEAGAQARDLSALEASVEAKLKEFHRRSPILETPEFYVQKGCLHCKWQSGLTLNLGNIVGPEGPKGATGTQGPQGVVGKNGLNGKDGRNGVDGKDGRDGKDGKNAEPGRDGKDGRMGPQGPRGAPGPVGLRGEVGKDGKDGERGLQGPTGLDGEDGGDGVGIEKAWVDDNHHLTLRLTSGKVIDAGYVRGKPGASSGKGGRVTGGYTGGGSGSNFYVTGADYNASDELVITNSNGSTINAGRGNTAVKILYITEASQLSGTLDSTVLYFLDGQIDMGTTSIVVPSGGLSLAGHGFGISGLVSTEDNHTMFVTDGLTYSGDLFLTSLDIRCSGVGSKVFDLDNLENFNACEWSTVNFLSCTSLGEIKNYRQGLGRNVAWISCKDGLTMTGAWSGGFAIVDSIVVGAPLTGVLFRAGAGLLIGGSFRSNINILGLGTAGGYFCDFAPANFTLDAGFNLTGVRANKAVNNIPNMPASSTKALITGCTGIGNTYAGGAFRSTNQATITISTVDTLYQIGNVGDFSEGYWFSKANTNGLQLDSTQDIQVDVGGSMSFSGSTNREIEVQLKKYVSSTTSYVDIGPVYLATLNGGSTGTRAENVTFAATTGMSQNDRVEVWVKNVTDATDITVLAAGQFQVFER